MTANLTAHGGVVRFGSFGERGAVEYEPPGNTLDPRYDACLKHRVACDCREAEVAELLQELRADRRALQAAIDHVLRGHPTLPVDDDAIPCQCTGCVIARAAHLYPRQGHLSIGIQTGSKISLSPIVHC